MRDLDQDTAKMVEILLDSRKSYHTKLEYIKNELEESVRNIEFNYQLSGFFEDTCYALNRAVSKIQGFAKMKDNKTASSDNPPTMIDVRFADGKRIKVPYGQIALPSFGPDSYINMKYSRKDNVLFIEGIIQKKYTSLMDEIIEDAAFIVQTDSIYKNKAIKYDGDGQSPIFMDLSNIANTELFLTEEAAYATEPIEVRITNPDLCIKNGLDLKFGVLLEGNYGTGKTLYAGKLALKAIQNNWTFVYCSKPQNILNVLQMANTFTKNGSGVVLFVEDIDQVLNDRTEATNEISLLMDGAESKHNNLISIFSTNHIENIDPTFMRGKRIGSIVTLQHLDAMTAEKMLYHYLNDIVTGSLSKAAQEVERLQIVPAFLQEIIDRVKTHYILREGEPITEKEVLSSIKQFQRQMDIAKVKVNTETLEETYVRTQTKLITDKLVESNVMKGLVNHLKDMGWLNTEGEVVTD